MRVLALAKGLPGPFPRVLGVGFAMILVASCGDNGSQAQQQAALPPPTVTVAKPVVRAIVEDDDFVARFVAIDEVAVPARSGGVLEQAHFTAGTSVSEGGLPFTTTQRPLTTSAAGDRPDWKFDRRAGRSRKSR